MQKGQSDSSLQAQSTGEDSNSSDTAPSDHGDPVTPKTEPSDYPMLDDQLPFNTNGGLLDQPRTPTFPGALLGLQGNQKITFYFPLTKIDFIYEHILQVVKDFMSNKITF